MVAPMSRPKRKFQIGWVQGSSGDQEMWDRKSGLV